MLLHYPFLIVAGWFQSAKNRWSEVHSTSLVKYGWLACFHGRSGGVNPGVNELGDLNNLQLRMLMLILVVP